MVSTFKPDVNIQFVDGLAQGYAWSAARAISKEVIAKRTGRDEHTTRLSFSCGKKDPHYPATERYFVEKSALSGIHWARYAGGGAVFSGALLRIHLAMSDAKRLSIVEIEVAAPRAQKALLLPGYGRKQNGKYMGTVTTKIETHPDNLIAHTSAAG